ncbi:DUF932 domain-containing protein [Allobranchiibius huperziae]|uniref:Phage/plasmid-like protein (TIGR03299 family) n=1 Tax=Allobranchiibius huperziae TaxID=1874116 RepID=A0A853DIB6_9MICO|nr:DUF932 domain-containing protein [Allobranchiibius huperziae]NYJ76518.1 phage/plasmid-like protein (TIGR03299 family) [Allobranchiibius huperziae]
MAHELDTYGTQAAAVFARQDAWHRLGTVVRDRAFTAEEAMTLGKLGGWDVRKSPLQTAVIDADGVGTLEVPGHFATVRTSPFTGRPEALGVVGAGYAVLQNEDHAQFLNTLVDESGAIFDTAGSLRGGRQTFITLQMPETIKVGGSDEVQLNIAALNSHDGSSAFRLLLTPTRIVCANTQAAALRNATGTVSIRHTANARAQVQAARDALGLTFAYAEAFQAEADALVDQAMTDGQFWELVEGIYGIPDKDAPTRTQKATATRTRQLGHLWHDADTQADIRGTRWAGYQAVAEYVDHFQPVRAKGGDKATARALRSVVSPEATAIKTRAWRLATAAV